MDRANDVLVARDGAVVTVWLNRPERRNAFDDRVAARLSDVFGDLAGDMSVRAVVVAGKGTSFCAGGDIGWMKRVAAYTHEENLADAEAFQGAFEAIDRCPHPVVARVQGPALGGGAGLVAVADIVVASTEAVVGFPEVRLGLVPGVISPYVIEKIGTSHARHLFVTGERIGAERAKSLGLVHVVVAPDELDQATHRVVARILRGSPQAIRAAKKLVYEIRTSSYDAQGRVAREGIVDARGSDDGHAGTAAFLDKTSPPWLDPNTSEAGR